MGEHFDETWYFVSLLQFINKNKKLF